MFAIFSVTFLHFIANLKTCFCKTVMRFHTNVLKIFFKIFAIFCMTALAFFSFFMQIYTFSFANFPMTFLQTTFVL